METVGREGCNKRKADLIEKDLNRVEENLEEVAKLYDDAVEAMPWEEQDEARKTRDLLYNSSEEWIRRVRAKIRRLAEEMPKPIQGNIRRHLQRVHLPYFSGKTKDWPEFRRFFLELTDKEGLPSAVLMAQLREHLDTQEARAMIAGKTDPTEAWAALNS